MSTLEQRMHDGARAREVLENEAFISAFDAIEQEFIDAWASSPARDAEGRERIYTYLHALKKVKAALTYTLETGKQAQLEANYKKSLRERIGSVWSRE